MKKYLLIYHSPKEAMEKYNSMSQEEIQEVMAQWMRWKDNHEGAIIDFGNPVGGQHVVTPSGSTQENDDVSGYGIIQAEDIDQAKLILADQPMLADNDGSTISVYDIHEM